MIAISVIVFSVLTVTTRRILRAATYLLFVAPRHGSLLFPAWISISRCGADSRICRRHHGVVRVRYPAHHQTRRKGSSHSTSPQSGGRHSFPDRRRSTRMGLFHMPLLNEQSTLASIAEHPIDMHAIGKAMVGTEKFEYLLPFEAVSVLLLACIIGGVTVARKK